MGRPGKGRRASRRHETPDPDQSDDETDDADAPTAIGGPGYLSIIAVLAGASLLVGGLYAYDHSPHLAPTGYTWIAWTSPSNAGDIAVGSVGKNLSFQIVHHQPDTSTFKLSAAWLVTPTRSLANPLTFSIGPNRTFRGTLFVPPLPDGCTYRIVVVLTAARQIDPLTKKPQSWSINADVHGTSKSSKTCK